jgi:hypothetical protein
MATKKKKFSVTKEVRKLARERVGPVPAERVITPKSEKKAKYKLSISLDSTDRN